MKRPSTAMLPMNSSIIKVQHNHKQQQINQTNNTNLHNNVNDPLEINSSISNTKKQKLPDSMKKFLQNRKYVRQIKKPTQQQKFITPNTKQKVINQTHTGLKQLEVSNSHQIDTHFESNISHTQITQKKIELIPSIKQITSPINICPICQGQITQKNIAKAFNCRHIYCQQCAKSYVKFKINLFQQVPCPEQTCHSFLNTDSQFYRNFTKRQRRIYKKIHNFYTTQTDLSKKLCPKQQCQGIIILKEQSPTQQCTQCKTIFCSNCFLIAHQGQCRDYEIKFMQDTLHYRQCSKCHIVVQRTDGCNHMTCKCGNQFCYLCGGKWKHDHLCQVEYVDQDNGCDWGQNWQDHFLFLIKIPLKFIITTVYTSFWFILSFAAAPYNVFFFMYWIFLIFVGGPIEFIFEQDRQVWQVFLLTLIFPLMMFYCLPLGIQLFLTKFQDQCPFISDGYRCIIRI